MKKPRVSGVKDSVASLVNETSNVLIAVTHQRKSFKLINPVGLRIVIHDELSISFR
jgi:phosphoglycerate-specific signal transduction histidine kinase